MKRILLALLICSLFAGTGYCAPHQSEKHHSQIAPHQNQYNFVAVRRHKHHIPIYPYNYSPAPYSTQVIINTNNFSVGYTIGHKENYINYGGSFRL